ncbi:MAG: hypothetical protein NC344_09545 [Bacteroidales bacterium]|nr:hypothetical protein [Bacteroidales bacterium]MCM1148049.1 hypothetical protein [Bacteroidales bacterium]MCM1207254.1 hypothetical protein [Bacillota bacterium]MCM1509497.1 hypothetical protein [Clostridium sp.]
MKKILLPFLIACVTAVAHAQIISISKDSLYQRIMASEADYRVLYVFDDLCPCIMKTLPDVLELLKDNRNVELFVVCGQPKKHVEHFIDKQHVDCKYYGINPKKGKWIDLGGYMNKTLDFFEKYFGVDTKKMGASALCILDRQGKTVAITTWETADEEYMELLSAAVAGRL